MKTVLPNLKPTRQAHGSLGDWFRRLWRKDFAALERDYGTVRKAALGTSSGLTGGYTVPVEFVTDVLAVAAEESFFLRRADRVPMSTAETLVPHVQVSGTGAAGVSPFYGGVAWVWTPENAALTEDEPTFAQVSLKANTLIGYALISNQLLADGQEGELSRYLADLLGRATAWQLDYTCLRGTGIGQPLGVVNAPGRLAVTRTAGGDVQLADLAGMTAKLIPAGWSTFGSPRGCWAMHPSVLAKVQALAGWQLNQPSLPGLGGFTLHGLPVYITELLPALGTSGDVLLFVPSLYLVGLRSEIEVLISRDEPTAYLKNQSVIRVTLRADGRPRLESSVTLADGTATAAAYVVLS